MTLRLTKTGIKTVKLEKRTKVQKVKKCKQNGRKRARERRLGGAKTILTLVQTLMHEGALKLISFSWASYGAIFWGGCEIECGVTKPQIDVDIQSDLVISYKSI